MPKIHLIACGVLKHDVELLRKERSLEISTEYLEGGLHNVPMELNTRLQASVDAASQSGEYERIVIGYGICGRGTIGLTARGVPLAVPKVHDCISLFLGSDRAYKREFAGHPGTYYISAGWFEEQVQPRTAGSDKPIDPNDIMAQAEYPGLVKKYGEERAKFIYDFYNSWKENYSRAAFIDTGAGDIGKYESYARALSEEFGWEYKSIEGDPSLLVELLSVEKTTDRVLVVPPGHVTYHNSRDNCIASAPKAETGGDQSQQGLHETITVDGTAEDNKPERDVRRRLGLGIDAGGTYTDAVIYDFRTKDVLSAGKALTTRWDFTIGIENAIDTFEEDMLSRVDLVSVSTTLATNAIVENHGQKVGLLFMPGGRIDPEEIAHRPLKILSGKITISGNEIEAPDREEIRKAVKHLHEREGVSVFAISGYAGAVNPDHELLVKEIAMEETGLHACCGHELSDLYNFFVRANTAVLNARIIPLLEAFLEDIETSLQAKGINAPVMVVKGDGSLMSCNAAKIRPIETILSGPAASIAGAKYLLDIGDATVIDIGGTTSDIGTLKTGMVEVCSQGAKVGGWRTHVQALDMSTVGLGGDSEICFEKQELTVGPRRIAPMSWLGSQYDISGELEFLQQNLDSFITSSTPIQFLVKTGTGEKMELNSEEEKILSALEKGPCSILELAERTGVGYWLMLRFKRLEDHYLIQRCGITPTDILHIKNELSLWNRDAAVGAAEVMCKRAKISVEELCDRADRINTRRLVTELIKKQLPLESDPDSMDTCPSCQTIIDTLFGRASSFTVTIRFEHPVVGLGAPAEYFLSTVSKYLDVDIVIPRYAEVANAVGAITSSVVVKKEVSIIPTSEGTFAVLGIPGHVTYKTFEKAREYATVQLKNLLQKMAGAAGTSEKQVKIRIDDRIAAAADGSEVFLECRLAGEVVGMPDIASRY